MSEDLGMCKVCGERKAAEVATLADEDCYGPAHKAIELPVCWLCSGYRGATVWCRLITLRDNTNPFLEMRP